jgi:hypothetical protein
MSGTYPICLVSKTKGQLSAGGLDSTSFQDLRIIKLISFMQPQCQKKAEKDKFDTKETFLFFVN